jgi:hypothetical protein
MSYGESNSAPTPALIIDAPRAHEDDSFGQFRADLNPELASHQMIAELDGLQFHWLYVELLEPDNRKRQVYREFFDLSKSIYSHVQDDFMSLPSLLRRTNS